MEKNDKKANDSEKLEEHIEEEQEATEEKEMEDAKDELQDLNNKLLRLQADFKNYKNRVEKEKKSIYAFAGEEIISQMLPVLDNFDRALDSMDEDNSFYEGIKMIYDELVQVLTNNGLKEINCIDEQFDPDFHHAVFAEEVEGKEEGLVIEVLQKGYMLNDKVIRPSMVKVAK